MFDKIEKLIAEKGIKPVDCAYHTIRTLENNGKIRALAIKGENIVHIEYICPNCGNYGYHTQEREKVSKGAKYKFSTKCSKCGFTMKIEKLKGRPKER